MYICIKVSLKSSGLCHAMYEALTSVLYPDFLLPLLHFSPAKKHNEFTEEACLIIPSFDAQILQFQKQKLQLQWGSYCLFYGVQRGKETKIKCLLYAATRQTWCYLILIRKEFFENYLVAGLPAGTVVKNPSANAGDTRGSDSIPGSRRSLESEMATHSSISAWKSPWTEEPAGCNLWGRRVGQDWAHTHTLLGCKKLSSFHREDSVFLNNQRSMKKTQSTGNHLDKNPEPFLADYLEGKENPCTVSWRTDQ